MNVTELIDRYDAGERNFVGVTLNGAGLCGATLTDADLMCADFRGADLRGATLRGATLRGADLRGADLGGADLRGADLGGADLRDTDLRDTDFRGADFRGANLRNTDLRGAKVDHVKWPAPSAVLLASWGICSDELTIDLMRYDAANHSAPALFDRWAAYGLCPYACCDVQRSAHFTERRTLWSPGPSKSAYELMQMLLAEHCVTDKEANK